MLSEDIQQQIIDISYQYDYKIVAIETDKDHISKYYWKRKLLWSDGYFACSIGEVSSKTIQRYIETQG